MDKDAVRFLAAALAIAIGSIGPALGIGLIGRAGAEATGRNPEAATSILTNMILAIAFAEAVAIYALVVSLILIFVA